MVTMSDHSFASSSSLTLERFAELSEDLPASAGHALQPRSAAISLSHNHDRPRTILVEEAPNSLLSSYRLSGTVYSIERPLPPRIRLGNDELFLDMDESSAQQLTELRQGSVQKLRLAWEDIITRYDARKGQNPLDDNEDRSPISREAALSILESFLQSGQERATSDTSVGSSTASLQVSKEQLRTSQLDKAKLLRYLSEANTPDPNEAQNVQKLRDMDEDNVWTIKEAGPDAAEEGEDDCDEEDIIDFESARWEDDLRAKHMKALGERSKTFQQFDEYKSSTSILPQQHAEGASAKDDDEISIITISSDSYSESSDDSDDSVSSGSDEEDEEERENSRGNDQETARMSHDQHAGDTQLPRRTSPFTETRFLSFPFDDENSAQDDIQSPSSPSYPVPTTSEKSPRGLEKCSKAKTILNKLVKERIRQRVSSLVLQRSASPSLPSSHFATTTNSLCHLGGTVARDERRNFDVACRSQVRETEKGVRLAREFSLPPSPPTSVVSTPSSSTSSSDERSPLRETTHSANNRALNHVHGKNDDKDRTHKHKRAEGAMAVPRKRPAQQQDTRPAVMQTHDSSESPARENLALAQHSMPESDRAAKVQRTHAHLDMPSTYESLSKPPSSTLPSSSSSPPSLPKESALGLTCTGPGKCTKSLCMTCGSFASVLPS